MEESDLIPEGEKPKESLSESSSGQINNEGVIDSSEIQEVSNTNKVELPEDIDKNSSDKKDSLFKRILENGFDGITTNPNYKLLALLIILLINLSLFFVVGNLGKDFLRNSGIL